MVKGGQPRSLPYSQLFEEASNLIKFPNEDDEDEDEPAGADVLTFGQLQVVKDLVPEICEVQGERQAGLFRVSLKGLADISDDLQAYKLCLTKTCLRLHQKVERLATEQVFSGTFPTLSRAMAHDCLQTEGTDEKVQLRTCSPRAEAFLCRSRGHAKFGNRSFGQLPTHRSRKGLESFLRVSAFQGRSAHLLTCDSFSLLKQHIESMKASQALVEQQHRPKESSGKSKDDKTKGPNKKKKAPAVSRGVKELEKVSKRGMKPLTTFFQKKS
jgi:hypothetical protein